MYLFSRFCLFASLLYLQGCDQVFNRISGGAEDGSRLSSQASTVEDRVVPTGERLPTQVHSLSVNDAVRVYKTTEEEVIFRVSQSSQGNDVDETQKRSTLFLGDASRTPNAPLDSGLGISLTTEGRELVPSILLQGDSGVIELRTEPNRFFDTAR